MSKHIDSCGDVYTVIDEKLNSLNYHKTVPAFIYSIKCDLTEPEVRALQAIVAEMDGTEFEKFNSNVTIWSGPDFDHKMVFRRDGVFSNEFEPGFMDVNGELAFEIL